MKRIITIILAIAVLLTLSISPAFALSDSEIIDRVKGMKITISSVDYDYLTYSATIKFNKSDSGVKVDGYQVYSSLKKDSGFKKVKTTTSRKTTVKSLKDNSKYYFKIRGYRVVNGKTYYTKYSKKIEVKTIELAYSEKGLTKKEKEQARTGIIFDVNNPMDPCEGRTPEQARQYIKDWYESIGGIDTMAFYESLLEEEYISVFREEVDYLINNPETNEDLWISITGGDGWSLIGSCIERIAIKYGA